MNDVDVSKVIELFKVSQIFFYFFYFFFDRGYSSIFLHLKNNRDGAGTLTATSSNKAAQMQPPLQFQQYAQQDCNFKKAGDFAHQPGERAGNRQQKNGLPKEAIFIYPFLNATF